MIFFGVQIIRVVEKTNFATSSGDFYFSTKTIYLLGINCSETENNFPSNLLAEIFFSKKTHILPFTLNGCSLTYEKTKDFRQ